MSQRGSGIFERFGHRAWGAVVLVLAAALVSTIPLSASGFGAAEARAQARAVGLSSSVLEPELSLDLLSRDISGTAYRELSVRVQAGILSDDRVSVVRIWRLDGALIYSTAQRDDVAGAAARGDPWLDRALAGETVSVRTSAGTYHEGLRHTDDEQFQTFVPVGVGGSDRVDGVVEIDHRYGALRGEVLIVWRPVQAVLFLLLVAAVVQLARSVGRVPAGARRRRVRKGKSPDPEDVDIPGTHPRAARMLEGVAASASASAPAETPSDAAEQIASPALEELDLKLRASEAEREQQTGELQRIRALLVEREAELELSRTGASDTRAESKRANQLVSDAERKAAEAERRAADAERKLEETSKRAASAAERALEAEARLGASERQRGEAERTTRKEPSDRKLASDLKRAHGERDRLARQLGKLEEQLARVRSDLEDRDRDLGARKDEFAARDREAADATRQLARATEELSARDAALAARDEELANATERLASREAELATVNEELTRLTEQLVARDEELARRPDGPESDDRLDAAAETEAKLADALAKLEELEQTRTRYDEGAALSAGDQGALEARIAELEHARRSDVAEVQRAQEAFANAQVELVNANRKLKEAEAQIRRLERDRPSPAPDAPDTEVTTDVEPEPELELSLFEPELAPALAARDLDLTVAEGDTGVALASFDDLGGSAPGTDWPSEAGAVSATPPPSEAAAQTGRDDPPAEGLSLRERLARAAAGRRRGPLS